MRNRAGRPPPLHYICTVYYLLTLFRPARRDLSFTAELFFLKMLLLMRLFNVVIERVLNREIYYHLNMICLSYIVFIVN